jgi:DNA-directed RNA polymerase specialized sigma24 family protein
MADAKDALPSPDDITNLVRIKIRKFTRGRRVLQQDFEDLVQELSLQVWRQLDCFVASKATARTFIDRVLESKCATIMAAQNIKERRMMRSALSLDAVVSTGDGEESTIAETYSHDDYLQATGFGSPQRPEAIETRIDVESALRSLDPAMRQLAERLKFMIPAEIEREFRIPHATLSGHIRKLGRLLADQGLADYAPAKPRKSRKMLRRFSDSSGMC